MLQPGQPPRACSGTEGGALFPGPERMEERLSGPPTYSSKSCRTPREPVEERG